MVLRIEGKPRAALETLEPVLESRAELGIAFLTVKLALVEALESAFELGDTARIETLLGMIVTLRPGERPPLLTAHAARFRARLASDIDEAEERFRSATEVFGELGMVFSLAVTQLEHAERLLEHDRPEHADSLLAEAREAFERLGAAPSLERAAQASARTRPAEAVS